MNKSQLVDAVKLRLSCSGAEAGHAVDAVLGALTDGLVKDSEVALVGFGSFSVKASKAREGRNPATGATIQIPSRKQLKFKPSKSLEGSF